MKKTEELTVDGKTLVLSNVDKILYPAVGYAKGQLINYYARISPYLLPHLKDHAVTFKRYPNGVDGMFFYEKNCPSHRPDWVQTAEVWSKQNDRNMNFCLMNDRPSLVWAANLAVIELHASLALKSSLDCPTTLVFDLDPGDGCDARDCCKVAFWVKDELEKLGLESFAKTSGSKGIQVYAPLNTPTTFDVTKTHALELAKRLEAEYPDAVLHNMRKELRKGKIFIDWSQNDAHKTTVSVYSMRAKQRPTVSTPLKWDEVKKGIKSKQVETLEFTADDVLKRVEKYGDLFEQVYALKQRIK